MTTRDQASADWPAAARGACWEKSPPVPLGPFELGGPDAGGGAMAGCLSRPAHTLPGPVQAGLPPLFELCRWPHSGLPGPRTGGRGVDRVLVAAPELQQLHPVLVVSPWPPELSFWRGRQWRGGWRGSGRRCPWVRGQGGEPGRNNGVTGALQVISRPGPHSPCQHSLELVLRTLYRPPFPHRLLSSKSACPSWSAGQILTKDQWFPMILCPSSWEWLLQSPWKLTVHRNENTKLCCQES